MEARASTGVPKESAVEHRLIVFRRRLPDYVEGNSALRPAWHCCLVQRHPCATGVSRISPPFQTPTSLTERPLGGVFGPPTIAEAGTRSTQSAGLE